MADAEAIRRKRELLAAELHAYFWLTCKELIATLKEAMRRLPPSVLRELASRLGEVEAVTNQANLELQAAYLGAAEGRESIEHLLNRAIASIERLSEIAKAMTRRLDELLKA
jgi:hypothetical protein